MHEKLDEQFQSVCVEAVSLAKDKYVCSVD